MFNYRYVGHIRRLIWLKLRFGKRVQTDGIAFICPGVKFEIGKNAVLHLGRWSWIGNDAKVRCHQGQIKIGSKTVIGQEVTLDCYESIEIGRECIIADRSMFIDFDHAVMMIECPIREQGIYTKPVKVGHNVWVGHGACVLRGTTVGNNAILGSLSVVTKDVPDNAVVGGVPAKVIRLRDVPQQMRWVD